MSDISKHGGIAMDNSDKLNFLSVLIQESVCETFEYEEGSLFKSSETGDFYQLDVKYGGVDAECRFVNLHRSMFIHRSLWQLEDLVFVRPVVTMLDVILWLKKEVGINTCISGSGEFLYIDDGCDGDIYNIVSKPNIHFKRVFYLHSQTCEFIDHLLRVTSPLLHINHKMDVIDKWLSCKFNVVSGDYIPAVRRVLSSFEIRVDGFENRLYKLHFDVDESGVVINSRKVDLCKLAHPMVNGTPLHALGFEFVELFYNLIVGIDC